MFGFGTFAIDERQSRNRSPLATLHLRLLYLTREIWNWVRIASSLFGKQSKRSPRKSLQGRKGIAHFKFVCVDKKGVELHMLGFVTFFFYR